MTASDQPADMDNRSGQDFEEHRAVLFTLAYSMLGSAAEAEDIVQETWLRRQRVREPVRQERALLCRIATRLALNALRSEANRKESYLGPWLPEPVATEADLADDLILAETVSEATLMVLETLSPAERAAFLLVEVFSLSSAETGRIIDASDTAVRQLVHRARTRLQEGRTHRRANPSPELWTELTAPFARETWRPPYACWLLRRYSCPTVEAGPRRHAVPSEAQSPWLASLSASPRRCHSSM